MITALSFENFRVLKDVQVPLERFTVLVGPNGCGKTTVLRAAWAVARIGSVGAGAGGSIVTPAASIEELGGPWRIRTAEAFKGWSVRMAWAQDSPGASERMSSMTLEFDTSLAERKIDVAPRLRLSTTDAETSTPQVIWTGGAADSFVDRHRLVANLSDLPSARFVRFDPTRIASPSYVEGEAPALAPDGYGLASVLAHLASTEPETFQAIQDALRAVVPRVRRIKMPRRQVDVPREESLEWDGNRISRTVNHKVWGNAIEIELDGHGTLPAEDVSEGTLIALAVITATHHPTGSSMLLLDDLDRALHPTAQAALIETLRKVLDLRPDLQIVATSHSPYLIDQFEPSEVVVMGLGPDGFARAQRLSDHPKFTRLARGLSTGELWSSVGEDWTAEVAADGG